GRGCDAAGSFVPHSARASPLRDHYRRARRLAPPSRRADLSHPRGVFFVARQRHASRVHHVRSHRCPPAPSRPAPPSVTTSTSTTPPCATAPSGRGSAT